MLEVIENLQQQWNDYYLENYYNLHSWYLPEIEKEFYKNKLTDLNYEDTEMNEVLTEMGY